MPHRSVNIIIIRLDGTSHRLNEPKSSISHLSKSEKLDKNELIELSRKFENEWEKKTLNSTLITVDTGDIGIGCLYQNLVSSIMDAKDIIVVGVC